MKFIDSLKIRIKAGDGGKGSASFRREKFVPKGGPDGGDGGKGGDIIIMGDISLNTLIDHIYNNFYKADNGGYGQGQNKTGKNGADLIIKVPFGTIVKDAATGEILFDISKESPSFIAAYGGKGGKGNKFFASPTHRAPRYAEPGEKVEEKELQLDLKLIADVGIIGYPNAGKSTFISTVSAAKPKIADYPFTTLTPVLGVVKLDYESSYTLADMPGLIEGAGQGKGLGLRFLKHIERTHLLLHFIDSSLEESMIDRYNTIRNELKSYSEDLYNKPEIIVATKADSAVETTLNSFKEFLASSNKDLFIISSFDKQGVPELSLCISRILHQNRKKQE